MGEAADRAKEWRKAKAKDGHEAWLVWVPVGFREKVKLVARQRKQDIAECLEHALDQYATQGRAIPRLHPRDREEIAQLLWKQSQSHAMEESAQESPIGHEQSDVPQADVSPLESDVSPLESDTSFTIVRINDKRSYKVFPGEKMSKCSNANCLNPELEHPYPTRLKGCPWCKPMKEHRATARQHIMHLG